jgi:Tol biopolymer transport system component
VRSLSVAAMLSVLLVATTGCQLLNRSSATDGAQGRLAWPKDGDLWVYDFSSNQQKKITNLGSAAVITGATWSPDGQRVMYAQFWRRPNERASGADLFVANADGSNAAVFAERDAPNSVLDTPDWAPSGRVYYTQRRIREGREATSIVRQAEDGKPELVVENGYSPSVSADETVMLYVRSTRLGQSLMKKSLAEPGDGCELLADQVFQGLSAPKISPDGLRIAVGGSGEPNPMPSACGGAASVIEPSAAQQGGPSLTSWFVSVASAHGLPADVWTLGLDGGNLTRLADLKEDDPNVAWSPDGSRMAIFGIAALYVTDVRGGAPSKLVDQGGYGGLDWAP